MASIPVCKPVPTLQTLLEQSGAYLTFEADAAAEAAADSATGSQIKDETQMPESATSS